MGLVPKSVGKKRPSLQSRGAGPEEAARAGSEGREGPLLSSPEPGSPSLRVSGGGGGCGGAVARPWWWREEAQHRTAKRGCGALMLRRPCRILQRRPPIGRTR